MRPQLSSSSSHRRRRSSSRRSEGKTRIFSGELSGLITTFLLVIVLGTGPLILGAARLWIELPLLGVVALLLLVQGLRLMAKPAEAVRRRMDAIDWAVVLFAIYAIIRWLTSPTEYFSRLEALNVVGYAGVFLTCRYGMANRKQGMVLIYMLVLLGVGETAFGYYLVNHLDWFPFGPTEQLQHHYAPRWLGTYGCPNHYACLLVMAIGAALALGSFSKLPWPLRIILFYVSLMMMIGVMFSGSRGSWMALAGGICALVTMGIRNGTVRWWVPVTAALTLVVVAGFLFSLSPVVRSRLAVSENMVDQGSVESNVRVQLIWDDLQIAHDHPIFGTGPGTFVFVHPRYQDKTLRYSAVMAYNDYLNCQDDYGLLGFAVAMFFVAAVTLKFFRPLGVDHRWQDRVLVATGFAAWVALLIHSWVDYNMHIPANALWLFALTGLALGRFKEEPELVRHWSTISLSPLGRWLGGTVVLLSLVYGAEVTRTAVSDIIYEQAFTRGGEVPTTESIEDAEKALVYDRGNEQDLAFLGDLHRYRAGRQNDVDGRLSEAQQALFAYEKARQANTLDDSVLAQMGMTLDLMGRYPEAFLCYAQAVTAQPYNGQFWYRLGNHYVARGMLEKAEEAYLWSKHSPHGADGSVDAEYQIRALPEMKDAPLPPPGANPLAPDPETEGPAVVP